jgi:hypothetical protein
MQKYGKFFEDKTMSEILPYIDQIAKSHTLAKLGPWQSIKYLIMDAAVECCPDPTFLLVLRLLLLFFQKLNKINKTKNQSSVELMII